MTLVFSRISGVLAFSWRTYLNALLASLRIHLLTRDLQDRSLAAQLRSLRFLVLDEADRMIEAGHFQELDSILRMTARPPPPPPDVDMFAFTFSYLPAHTDALAHSETKQDPPALMDVDYEDMAVGKRNDALQTFIFSATMSKALQRDLKRRRRYGTNGKREEENATTLGETTVSTRHSDSWIGIRRSPLEARFPRSRPSDH